MSLARQTELLEAQSPKGGAFAVTLGVERGFTKIHLTTAAVLVTVTMMDGTTASMYLLQGHSYDVHGKIIASAGTPTITAWK